MSTEPANFSLLHRTCKLVVLLCLLHISITVVFYVRSLDIRLAFVQNQQSHVNVTERNQFTFRTGPAEAVTPKGEPGKGHPQSGVQEAEDPVKKLDKCPETSPLLGHLNFHTPY